MKEELWDIKQEGFFGVGEDWGLQDGYLDVLPDWGF